MTDKFSLPLKEADPELEVVEEPCQVYSSWREWA